jgi:hypothetical protein
MIQKTLQPTNDLFLQFTEEEIQELGWEPNQKLQIIPHDDGSFEVKPFVKVEIDTSEWSKEILEMIVNKSLDEDISCNDVINNLLKEFIATQK